MIRPDSSSFLLNPFESVASIPRKWLNQKSLQKFPSGLMVDESHSSNISKSFWDQIKLLKRNGAQQVMVNQINGNYQDGLTRRQWLLKWLICKLKSVAFDFSDKIIQSWCRNHCIDCRRHHHRWMARLQRTCYLGKTSSWKNGRLAHGLVCSSIWSFGWKWRPTRI